MSNFSRLKKIRYALHLARLAILEPAAFQTIRTVRREKLSYLGFSALYDLYSTVRQVERARLPGIMIEGGCALGGSALVMASAKQPQRPFFIYDTFELIPPPGTGDGQDAQERYQKIISHESEGIRGDAYYGYIPNLLERIEANFERYHLPANQHQIHLVKGLFQDTMQVSEPVSLAHLDCDWYESVMTCLTQIEPRLVPGGVLIIDDYFDWSGARSAVDEYFADKHENYMFVTKSRLHIQKKMTRYTHLK